MHVTETHLKDAYVITTQVFEDDRGSFTESFNLKKFQEKIGSYEFVQDCHSVSKKGVVRGLHYQIKHPQGKLLRCLSGSVYDVMVDLRKDSPTFGRSWGTVLDPGPNQIWIPPGFAHGFRVLSETAEVLYKVTNYQYKEFERTLQWDDPHLHIDWGVIEDVILSDKDKKGISFDECEKYES